MPTYVYECAKCGDEFELYQSFSEDPLKKHPRCGGRVAKVFQPVGIVLKGSGFYKNDSRSGAKRAKNGDSSPSEKTEKSEKSEKSDTGSKTEPTSTSSGSSSGNGDSKSTSTKTDSPKPSTPAAKST
jgi:putative FmdB family regulatory protein